MISSLLRSPRLFSLAAVISIGMLSGCGGDVGPDQALNTAAVATYVDGVYATYSASVTSATTMDAAIDAFVADPTVEALEMARTAWLDARDDYGLTEAFRFYGGPIDDESTGTEGLINAWPLDEAYLDYVEGDPEVGIINDPVAHPTIDAELLVARNEAGGETNISSGWHAIEFLLWGQDLAADGPGNRPVEDYTVNPNAERRATYLAVASDLLVDHLEVVQDAWSPDADNYRAQFLALDTTEALRRIITGVGELSRGELAGERMNVAYSERSQEDEHSCFSDNTTADLIANARSIQMVLTGVYPAGVEGTGIIEAVDAVDDELADRLRTQVAASVAAVEAIPAPFDQHLADGVPDNDPGRSAILAGIEALEEQTPTIVAAAEAIGVAINVS